MLSISSLLEFLLALLRDDEAQAEFARDPQAMLARHNLDGVTAQDIRETEPLLADLHGVSLATGDGRGTDHGSIDHGFHHGSAAGGSAAGGSTVGLLHGSGHHPAPAHGAGGPIHEIQQVAGRYSVDHDVVVRNSTQNTFNEYQQFNSEIHNVDQSVTADHGGVVIQDSFNQDNDGVDNKGGVIGDSTVAGGQGAGDTTPPAPGGPAEGSGQPADGTGPGGADGALAGGASGGGPEGGQPGGPEGGASGGDPGEGDPGDGDAGDGDAGDGDAGSGTETGHAGLTEQGDSDGSDGSDDLEGSDDLDDSDGSDVVDVPSGDADPMDSQPPEPEDGPGSTGQEDVDGLHGDDGGLDSGSAA